VSAAITGPAGRVEQEVPLDGDTGAVRVGGDRHVVLDQVVGAVRDVALVGDLALRHVEPQVVGALDQVEAERPDVALAGRVIGDGQQRAGRALVVVATAIVGEVPPVKLPTATICGTFAAASVPAKVIVYGPPGNRQ
jgi:hypothetical protein